MEADGTRPPVAGPPVRVRPPFMPPAPNASVQAGTTTVREATIALLRARGLTTMFGNPGSTELPMLADWPEDFRYVLGLQEAAVVCMADGFSQVTREPVIVNLHTAPGVGNA